MGVVYLAEDLSLGRKIALKFLSRDFARDRTAVERFRREARTASALNHPNICTIHEISEHDGQPFIAMEWLEGQSLRDLLRVRRLSIDELLAAAIDVADGLDAAHRAGIVHRDIKPGNIFILARNRAKLLDFGLAKMGIVAPIAAPDAPTAAAPDAAHLTDPGVTLGTVAYMSPEQARGETLDARSDLFSLGVVLYEAVTGERPFTGSSQAVVFHEILGKTPAPPLRLNPNTHPDLDRLVMKALEKDREVRYQSAADMLSDLKRMKRDRSQTVSHGAAVPDTVLPTTAATPAMVSTPSETAVSSASSSSDAQTAAALVKRHTTAAIGVVVLALALLAIFYFLGTRRSQPTPAAAQDLQVQQITYNGNAEQPAISSDGKLVAYVSGDGVWLRQTATSSNVQIVPPESGVRVSGLTITPDSNFVDFVRQSTGVDRPPSLWRVPLLGGTPPKLLVEDVHSPIGWSPDGRRMAFIRSNLNANPTSLIVADADGRNQKVLVTHQLPESRFLTVLMPGVTTTRPSWSPDGRVIANLLADVNVTGGLHVEFINASDGTVRAVPLRSGASGVDWIDGASLVIATRSSKPGGAQLWRLSYPDGALSRLTNDLSSYTGISIGADRNTLVTAKSEEHGLLWLADGAATAGTEIAQPIPGQAGNYVIAWNGDRLLFTAFRAILALTSNAAQPEEILKNAVSPAVTSDGKTMVYLGADASSRGLWKADADGRNPTQLVSGGSNWPIITPDDRNVIYGSQSGGIFQLWTVLLAGGKPRLVSPLNAVGPAISPSGRSLAFASEGQNQWIVTVCELPECAEPRRVFPMNVRVLLIRWTPDGHAIAYATNTSPNITVHPLDGSPERQLTHFTDSRSVIDFAWSRDGKHFAVARNSVSQDIVLFRGIKPTP
jgi:serine/threonine protein kinase